MAGLPAGASERQPARPALPVETEARVIVALKPGAALLRERQLAARASAAAVAEVAQGRADRLAAHAGRALIAGRMVDARAQVLRAQGLSSAALAAALAAHPEVEYAVVDGRKRALLVPNDPLYMAGPAIAGGSGGPEVGQWHLRAPTALLRSAVNAEAAWDRVSGDPRIVVAVIDTGVWAEHLDLAGRVLPGYDMISDAGVANDSGGRDADASDPGDWITAAESSLVGGPFQGCGASDSSWHGTMMSSIVGAAANDGIGMAGIAGTGAGVRILPVRVLGKCGGFDSDIVAGMRWAAGIAVPGLPVNPNPARVLNVSLGGGSSCSAVYRNAVAEVVASGAVVVAAAGNSVGQAVASPANCPGVIAVAGIRHAGSKVGFSDQGPEIAISAPGGNCVNILPGQPCLYPIVAGRNSATRGPNAGGSTWSDSFRISVGTSFATPIVAGTVALMLSARPSLTPGEIRQALQSTARPFPTSGADNGTDPTPVTTCVDPATLPASTEQLQCYCTTALCGAGMLDTAAALAAVSHLVARIELQTPVPTAGAALQLSSAGSLLGPGRSVATIAWTIVDAGSTASSFSSATNASAATLLPGAAGTLIVRLTVTDNQGERASADLSIAVAAVPPPAPVPEPVPPSSAGGGASSGFWLALLALAVWRLRRVSRSSV